MFSEVQLDTSGEVTGQTQDVGKIKFPALENISADPYKVVKPLLITGVVAVLVLRWLMK